MHCNCVTKVLLGKHHRLVATRVGWGVGYRIQFSLHCAVLTIPEGGFHVISALCAVTRTRTRETRDSNHTHRTSHTQSGRTCKADISHTLHELDHIIRTKLTNNQAGNKESTRTITLTNKTHNKLIRDSLHTITTNKKEVQQVINNSPHTITTY